MDINRRIRNIDKHFGFLLNSKRNNNNNIHTVADSLS